MSVSTTQAALAAALLVLAGSPLVAGAEVSATVTFGGEANMPSLKDPKQHDKFNLVVSDAQVVTNFNIQCKAGTSALGGLVKANEECAVTGNGTITNPNNPEQKFPRTQYTGGFAVQPDGSTDMSKVQISYLPVGKVQASTSNLNGVINLKPENPSPTANMLKELVLKKMQATATGDAGSMLDTRVDTVELPDLFIPSAGFASDQGCRWRGSMAFSYQSESWYMDLTATCGGKTYAMKGNMPWIDAPGVKDRTLYNLVLTLPTSEAASDAAMFAAPTGDSDMFATVNGISGSITMDESLYVDTLVDGKTEHLPMHTKFGGSITGHGVPLDTVRSFANLIAILSRTFFGA
jgi:hypothetical protein